MTILTESERGTLRAVCQALLPSIAPEPGDDSAFFAADAASRDVPRRMEETLHALTAGDVSRFRLFLRILDQPLFLAFQCGRAARFRSLDQADAERVLLSLATSRLPDLRAGFQAVRRLATFHYYSGSASDGSDPVWRAIGYQPSDKPPAIPRPLEITGVTADTVLDCDACVIGSGAGGSVAAAELAASGLDVVVLEASRDWQSEDFDQLEARGVRELYQDSGTTATRDLSLSIFAGASVGGGTTVNWQTSLRTPDNVRQEWAERSGCAFFIDESFTRSLDHVWSRLSVGTGESQANPNNAALRDGCAKLGYDWQVTPRNSRGCDLAQCGYCIFGCRHGGKQTAGTTYLVDAARTGKTRVIAECAADRLVIESGQVRGVTATAVTGRNRFRVTVRSRIVVAACGSLQTPALLLRSGVALPQLGRNLHLHPTTAVGAMFEHRIEAWMGAPQTVVCNEFAGLRGGYGFRVETAPAHPGLIALATPWLGARSHRREMQGTDHKALLIALIRDKSSGRVTIDRHGRPLVDYKVASGEAQMLKEGISRTARILHASGATGVQTLHTIPLATGRCTEGARSFSGIDTLCDAIEKGPLGPNQVGLFSAHQMGTCRMGRDARTAVCDGHGEVFGVKGLYIADASAFPGSSGVNPMVTIMAMAHHTAQGIARR